MTATNNQPGATENIAPKDDWCIIMTTLQDEQQLIDNCAKMHLRMVGRTVVTNHAIHLELLKQTSIRSIDDIPPPEENRTELAVVLSFAVDYNVEPYACQLGHILSDPMVRLEIDALIRRGAVLNSWYRCNPIPGKVKGPEPEPKQPMLDPENKPPSDELFNEEKDDEDEVEITPENRLHWTEQALKMMSNSSIQFEFGGVLTDTIKDALNCYSEELQRAIEQRDFDAGPEEDDEDKDAWKQRVIAHDVAVMQSHGWQVVGAKEPVAPPKPARKPRPAITQAPHLTIGSVKGAFKRAVEYLRLLEMLHEGQYVGSEDEHTCDGKPHEGCFNCLSYYTAAHYLLDMLDRMGSMTLVLFDVPGREEDLVEAIQLYAWATHRIDRQEMGDNYLREGQEEVYNYAAGAVDDIYRRSREMWILTPEQEANEISIEVKDRLDLEFGRTYLEETHRYQEWCQAYVKNKGKVPFYRF